MAQNWPVYCNQKAYGLNTSGVPNKEKVKFKSGRVVEHLRNSANKKEFAVKFKFDDSQSDPTKIIDGFTEYQHFINWLDNTLRGCTLSFYFPDILMRNGVKEYKIKEYPQNITGQKWKYVSLVFVEV